MSSLDKFLASLRKTEIVDISINDNLTISQSNSVGNYILNFKDISNPAELTAIKEDRNLIITKDSMTVILENYFSADGKSSSPKFATLRYTKDGKAVDTALLDALVIPSDWMIFTPNKAGVISGSIFSDTIVMTDALEAPLNNKGKGLTINTGRGNDVITGSKYNDTITGGTGFNTYNYDFGQTSGYDTINLTKGECIVLNLTDNNQVLLLNNITFQKTGNNLIIYKNGNEDTNQLCIKNFFTSSANVSIGNMSINDYLLSEIFAGLGIYGKGKINGTQYNDIINASTGNDNIKAGNGDDIINTNGGKDVVVETGHYGKDIINSNLNSTVTINLTSFDTQNITFTETDLKYTTDDNSSFTYSNFVTGNCADLWINAKNKVYHIVNNNGELLDFSNNTNNNVIYMTGENQGYIGSKKGINTIYSTTGDNTYVYNGANETYNDSGESDDTYTTTINKAGTLIINDDGGNDTITLNNRASDITLYFNIDANETLSDASNMLIHNRSAMTSAVITKGLQTNNYTGAINIQSFFAEGNIETFNLNGESLDIDGWKYFVKSEVGNFLRNNEFVSSNDVFLNGTSKQKNALLNVFKSLTYQKYLDVLTSLSSNDDWFFTKYGDDLLVLNPEANVICYEGYFLNNGNSLSYYALDENDKIKKYVVGSEDSPITILADSNGIADGSIYTDFVYDDNATKINLYSGNDTIVFFDSTFERNITTADGSKDTFIFEDKKYEDFYTKESATIAYNSGDPLIAKSGDDLIIGDITVKDIDGKTNEIQLIDMEGNTKNIIIGSDTISGTFESEIIIGSNSSDNIYSNGGNDLIFMGDGNDKLYVTAQEASEETGKNTAEMIGIGGTHTISNNLDVPAISVYDSTGNDEYNTNLLNFGLYIEDFAGNDTLNITYSGNNLMYFFDVINPNHINDNPLIYTDLMICDKNQFSSVAMSTFLTTTGKGMKALMESMQGSFGYAWIDDHYGNEQTIENINIVNNNAVTALNVDYTDANSSLNSVYQSIATWLSSSGSFFGPSQDFATAWDVLEHGSKMDIMQLANLYMNG